jgi:hypothetical protein
VLAASASLLLLSSFKKSGSEAAAFLKIDSTSLSLSIIEDAKDSFMVESNGPWSLSVNPASAWLQVIPQSGTGNQKVYVTTTAAGTQSASIQIKATR